VSRILARAGMPRLWDLDPVTGARIRASRRTDPRYERVAPGDMIHVDVKKLGRIPAGGAGGLTRPRPRPITVPRTSSWASTTSTPPSMTIPAWPTRKSCRMKKYQPAPASSAVLLLVTSSTNRGLNSALLGVACCAFTPTCRAEASLVGSRCYL